ncbi:MAG: membrane dipeptidase [Chloroflexota bacterium]
MLIIDGHEDIAFNVMEFGRDPRQSAFKTRELERGTRVPEITGNCTVGKPEWLVGEVGVIFATLFSAPERHGHPGEKIIYSTAKEAEALAMQQIDIYKRLADQDSSFRVVTSKIDFNEVIASWQGENERQIGLVILMEGADPIVRPDDVFSWWEAGVRIIGLSWKGTRYAGGTGEPGPLSDIGRILLENMANLNMILDLSHLAEEAYYEAVSSYPGVIIASHANPRKFCPTDRGLSDEMIRKLADRDGVMGIVPYNAFLLPGWNREAGRAKVKVSTITAAIDHVNQLTGNGRHVAIGSDFDGGFGYESIPEEMNTIADMRRVIDELFRIGYSTEDVEAIMHGNWSRVLKKGL